MAITVSLMQSATVADIFNNTIAADWNSDAWKVALFNNTLTPDPDVTAAAFGVAPYNANEVFGTGWVTGGVTLASPTCTVVAGVGVMFDATDVSQATTTLTNAQGCLIYDSTVSSRGLIFVNFGAAYSTSAGTFGITWDANGVARLDLTP